MSPEIGSYMQIQNIAAMSAAALDYVPAALRPHGDTLAMAVIGVVLIVFSMVVRRTSVLCRRLAAKYDNDRRPRHGSTTKPAQPAVRPL